MAENPLIKKLGIKPGQRLLIVKAPAGYVESLGELPEGAEASTGGDGQFDFVQVFVQSKADVDREAPRAVEAVKPGGLLWFAYPKQSAKVKTDINRDSGWEALDRAGIRPVTQISIDETWSALRFRPRSEVKARPGSRHA